MDTPNLSPQIIEDFEKNKDQYEKILDSIVKNIKSRLN
jgi:hypothetical protein